MKVGDIILVTNTLTREQFRDRIVSGTPEQGFVSEHAITFMASGREWTPEVAPHRRRRARFVCEVIKPQPPLSSREVYGLWMMLGWHCHRYILETVRLEHGVGRTHWMICRILAAYITGKGGDYLMQDVNDSVQGDIPIHRWMARECTDHFDRVIGLPLDVRQEDFYKMDWDMYTKRFFDWLMAHYSDMAALLQKEGII